VQQNILTPKPKTWAMRMVEERYGKPVEQLIHELYVEQGMTTTATGAHLGIDGSAVSRWMERLGIPARPRGKRAA